MAKAEWGTKRQCPKCGTRFYDLGADDPIVCIDCEQAFKPEIILKSKTHSIELITDKKAAEDEEAESLLDDDALLNDESSDDVEISADDNTVVLSDDDDTNVAAVVDAPSAKPTTEE